MSVDAVATIRAAQDAARQLTDTEVQLRERHASLVRERDQVRYGLASQAECLANVDRLVDERRVYLDGLRNRGACRALSGYLQPRTSLGGTGREQRVAPTLPRVGDPASGALAFDDLIWLIPGLVKDGLNQMVKAGDRFGLPPKERADRLAGLEAEIADVEQQHTELVNAAGAVGISLSLLDAVKKRLEEQRHK